MARPTRKGPAAANGEAQKLSRINAVAHTRNQPSAQSNPEALLDEARAQGIRVGAAPDASEMIVVIPMRVPREIAHWFEHELYKNQAAIFDYILRENAGRRS